MRGEEITEEDHDNNNNDNIYAQFAADYTTVKAAEQRQEKLHLASSA